MIKQKINDTLARGLFILLGIPLVKTAPGDLPAYTLIPTPGASDIPNAGGAIDGMDIRLIWTRCGIELIMGLGGNMVDRLMTRDPWWKLA